MTTIQETLDTLIDNLQQWREDLPADEDDLKTLIIEIKKACVDLQYAELPEINQDDLALSAGCRKYHTEVEA